MATGFPDWLRAIALMGQVGGEYRIIALDEDNNLNIYIRGEDEDDIIRLVRVDDDGRIITKIRGRDGNYVVVDAEGNMTTVIKGWDGLALKTVKVDDAGRLSAFVIDSTDAWGRMLSVGNAELAARTGSANRYEQRGQVQLIESFETGRVRWANYPGGANAKAELDPTLYVTGGYSMRLTAGTTDPWKMRIESGGGTLASTRVGLEMSFSLRDEIDKCDLLLSIFDGTQIHRGGLRYDHTNAKLLVRTAVDTWAEVADVAKRTEVEWIFSRMKFVVDTSTGKYLRAYLDQSYYPLTVPGLYVDTVANAPRTYAAVDVFGDGDFNHTMNVDDVILTSAEPL